MSLRRNAIYGALGFAIPTAAILVAYPVLIRYLGHESFGIFVLATSFGGLSFLADLGISAAIVKFLAEDLASANRHRAAELIRTAIVFYVAMGVIVATALGLLAERLIVWFSTPASLETQALWSFRLGAAQFAFYLVFACWLSICKGVQRFDLAAFLGSTNSALSILASTVAAAASGGSLIYTSAANLGATMLAVAIGAVVVLRLCAQVNLRLGVARATVAALRRMIGFGSAMLVNGISGILLYQLQRFLIGAWLEPAAVGIYQIATAVPARAHALVAAATETMFPFAAAERDRKKLRRAYLRMLGGSAVVAVAVLLPLATMAEPLLSLWIDAKTAASAAPLLVLACAAYAVLALSPAPYHLLNGIGRPWINTASFAFNALLNVLTIVVLTINGATLADFVLAFLLANVINGIAYQTFVELFVWRRRGALAVPS